MHRIDTEIDKNSQLSNVFMHFFEDLVFFSQFLTDFVNWNVEKVQQGKNVLSSMLRKEIIAVLKTKIVRNRHRKRQNSEKFSDFHIFVQFL